MKAGLSGLLVFFEKSEWFAGDDEPTEPPERQKQETQTGKLVS